MSPYGDVRLIYWRACCMPNEDRIQTAASWNDAFFYTIYLQNDHVIDTS